MITYYKNDETGLKRLEGLTKGCWVNVFDPTTNEIEQLADLGFPQDFITYPLDIDELARSERDDEGTLFILLRIPYYQGAKMDVPYVTIPLGIILTEDYIITVCRWENDILRELASGRIRGLSTAKHNRFLLQILLSTATKYLTYLREINKAVDILEDKLQLSMQNREMLELLKHQKSLVYFTTALKSNELMLERLQRSQLFRMYPEDEDLLEDVITENRQAIEMSNISSNILSSMMDAFASIISNNLNFVMKFLASITVVLSIPTIVTSFFGMNVDFPTLFEQETSYLIVTGMIALISVLVIAIFARRNWF
ncbi:MAG: magnesium transporter CorA family protein [Anaerolineae bacterium]|nr:magnesium transporter CorA family protein [Anaerolineae bacterium]